MRRRLEGLDPLARYTAASERAAARIIGVYSTSFGAATRLLGRRHRRHIRNVYALVRIADELVDGVAAGFGLPPERQRDTLDALETETERALVTGCSGNPIVHAFALTAREAGIGVELTRPFFASMRMDLPVVLPQDGAPAGIVGFGAEAHAEYVHGSAEVVGLMCLRVFIREEDRTEEQTRRLQHGARRLGAAFQNVNFLRDFGDDTQRLGRGYLSERGDLDDERLATWIATIREQLGDAAEAVPLLPRDARVAVGCALRIFARLTDRLAVTPVSVLRHRRVRVPGHEKAWLMVRSASDLRHGRTA